MRNFTYSMRTQPESASDMRFGPTFPHPGCGFCLYSRIRYAVLPIFPHPGCGICLYSRIRYAATKIKRRILYAGARIRYAVPAYGMRCPHTVCGSRILVCVPHVQGPHTVCSPAYGMRDRIRYAVPAYGMRTWDQGKFTGGGCLYN